MEKDIAYLVEILLLGVGAWALFYIFYTFFSELGEAIHDETTCETCQSLKRMGEEASLNKH